MDEDGLIAGAPKDGVATGYLRHVLAELPDICLGRLTGGTGLSDCIHCRKVVDSGLRDETESAVEAVERVLYHLSNQECEGAIQLRRQEASRILAGPGAPT